MASVSEPHTDMSKSHVKMGPAILDVAISSIIVALLCVLLRIYIRIRITRSFWWDDGLIVEAMVIKDGRIECDQPDSCIAFQALSILGAVFNSSRSAPKIWWLC